MKLRVLIQVSVLTCAFAVLTIAFQNCAPMNFSKDIHSNGANYVYADFESLANPNLCAETNQVNIEFLEPKGGILYCIPKSYLSEGLVAGSVACENGPVVTDLFTYSKAVLEDVVVPCEEIEICGVKPEFKSMPMDDGNIEKKTKLTFNQLPWGCEFEMQIKLKDEFDQLHTIQTINHVVKVPECRKCESLNKFTCGICYDPPSTAIVPPSPTQSPPQTPTPTSTPTPTPTLTPMPKPPLVSKAACNVPWLTGPSATIEDGISVNAYSVAAAASPTLCSSLKEVRVCSDGKLSGSFPFGSCLQSVTFTGSGSFSLPADLESVTLIGKGGTGGDNSWSNPGQPKIDPVPAVYGWHGSFGPNTVFEWVYSQPGPLPNTSWCTSTHPEPSYTPTAAGIVGSSTHTCSLLDYTWAIPNGYIYQEYDYIFTSVLVSPAVAGQPYIPPSSGGGVYSGANTTATVNGALITFDGGFGGPANESTKVKALIPSVGATTTYNIASPGGKLEIKYQNF